MRLLTVALLAATPALAQAPEVDTRLFRPASGSDGLFGVEGARGLEDPGHPIELQLGLDAQWQPVRASTVGLGPGARLDRRIAGWLQLASRLDERLSFFAELPVIVKQGGDLSALTATPEYGFGVADIRLGLRGAILRQGPQAPFDLGVGATVQFGTAQPQALAGDDRVVGELLFAAGRRSPRWGGDVQVLGNLYLRLRPPHDLGEVKVGSMIVIRTGAAYFPGRRAPWLPRRAFAELELSTSLRELSQRSLPAEWRAGASFCAGSSAALEAAVGTRLDDALGAPTLRGAVSLRYAPALCAAPAESKETTDDLLAAIARERERKARAEAEEQERRLGAQLGASEADARARVLDLVLADLLPASETDALALASAFATEETRDTDGDGVPDRLDNCPREKGPPENGGCPRARRQVVILREDRIEIREKVFFATGKARIQPRSHRLLDQVARVLKQHPDLVLVRVEGHTDDTGSARTNTALSQARAESVVSYLRKKGVPEARLTPRGYGPSKPLAPNATKAGREKNRRVEFRVVRRKAAREVIEVEGAASGAGGG